MTKATHFAHCNRDDYEGSCKYGDDDCPAMTDVQQAVPVAQEMRDFLHQAILATGDAHIASNFERGVHPIIITSEIALNAMESYARHRLASLPCKSGEGADAGRELVGWQYALDPCPVTHTKRWIYAIVPTEAECKRAAEGAYGDRQYDIRPVYALTPDATQTREAEGEEGDGDSLTGKEAWDVLVNVDDRTSPEEYPDMCLITRDELIGFMARAARNARDAA